ncbi:MAG: DUF4276 family protein [Treponema sp.]|nr:DUF4276 family protein [Treponema sp.]
MQNVYVICEGQAEANFVNRVLFPQFYGRLNFIAPIITTNFDKRAGIMHKGGMVSYAKAVNTISISLKQVAKQGNGAVTTMFDFYALANDVPGFCDAEKLNDPYQKVSVIEQKMHDAIPVQAQRFYHPYIQLHEFEALIFCNLPILGQKYFTQDITNLENCLAAQNNPELINNGYNTAPSKRILSSIPNYDKVNVGVQVLEETNFSLLRNKCRHFDEWITWLENL